MSAPLFIEHEFDSIQAEYDRIKRYSKHIAEGSLRSMIVSGPPGVGKSFMIKQFLAEYGSDSHQFLHGKITPLSLYHALYTHRNPKQVVVLDDTDSIFKDPDGQNILKAVMDTLKVRTVTWASTTNLLARLRVPEEFQFQGSIVLITNVGFDGNTKLSVHLRAIKDRSFALQVGSDDIKSRLKMIAFMVYRKDMLAAYNLADHEKDALMNYLAANIEKLTTVSLRTIVKLADLYRLEPTDWRLLGEALMVSA